MHNLGLLPHVELMVNPMQSSHRLGALTFAKFIGGYLTSMFHIITYKQYLSHMLNPHGLLFVDFQPG